MPIQSISHLEREIHQQPALWRATADTLVERSSEIDAFLAPLLADNSTRIVLTGAGTSAYAGSVAAPALVRHLQRPVEAVATTDIVADPHGCLPPDAPTLLVSFARSGNSPESLAATRIADQRRSPTAHLILTCNPNGELARNHEARASSLVLAMPPEANDRSFAMTSSFTCMTLASLLTLDGTHRRPGPLIDRLTVAADDILDRRAAVTALADLRPERVVYLGSGALHGLARESALKLTELTAGQVVATGESSLGFRHGPKAVLTSTTQTIVYLSNDPYTRRYDLDILAEVANALSPGQVTAVDGSEEPWMTDADVNRISLRSTGGLSDAYWALPAVVLAQLLGLAMSQQRDLDPDNPFPGGQVNRVVQGVTIHPLPGRLA